MLAVTPPSALPGWLLLGTGGRGPGRRCQETLSSTPRWAREGAAGVWGQSPAPLPEDGASESGGVPGTRAGDACRAGHCLHRRGELLGGGWREGFTLELCFAVVLWSKTPASPTNRAINRRASRFQGEEKAELG